MSNLRESIDVYIKRVKELADHVRGNEQATKLSLIGPFFTMLGYDLTDLRECMPEFLGHLGNEMDLLQLAHEVRRSAPRGLSWSQCSLNASSGQTYGRI